MDPTLDHPSPVRTLLIQDLASRMALTTADTTGGARLGDDFPIICSSCLGPNPYVRMLKVCASYSVRRSHGRRLNQSRRLQDKMGKACRISGHPFTAFRWQGEHKRWKETIVSPEAARDKNCCQACLNDLEYGVSFHVRDRVMEALGEDQVNARRRRSPRCAPAGGPYISAALTTHVSRCRRRQHLTLAPSFTGPTSGRGKRREMSRVEAHTTRHARAQPASHTLSPHRPPAPPSPPPRPPPNSIAPHRGCSTPAPPWLPRPCPDPAQTLDWYVANPPCVPPDAPRTRTPHPRPLTALAPLHPHPSHCSFVTMWISCGSSRPWTPAPSCFRGATRRSHPKNRRR